MRDELQSAINAKVAEERRALEGRISELAAMTSAAATAVRKSLNGHSARRRRGSANKTHASHPAKGTRVAPKYRGPNGEKWSGRGLTPRWLADLEKSGKKRESYLIKG
jgi:DNA-binding protein H-NS